MTCLALLCVEEIPETRALCAVHQDMLCLATRALVNKTFRPGRPASKRFVAAIGEAQREITYYGQHGHRIPVNELLGDSARGR